MNNKFLKTNYFLDDQDYSFSESLQTFYLALMPDYQTIGIPTQSRHITRSVSFEPFRPGVLREFQVFIRYLRSMRRAAIIKWSFALHSADVKNNGSLVSLICIWLILFFQGGTIFVRGCGEGFLRVF